MLQSLSTGHMIGLAVACIGFSVLAFTAAMIVPRFKPDFPGKNGMKLFILASMACTAATLLAVEFWAVEEKKPHAENVPAHSAEK